MLAERGNVGGDIAVFRIAEATFLGELRAELGESADQSGWEGVNSG
jgi:hypothetical protein